MAGSPSTWGSNAWGYGSWAYVNNPDAASGWGSNAWGHGSWEDNAVVIDYGAWGSLVEGFGDGTWGLGVQLSTLSTSAGTAIASISIDAAITGQVLTTSIGTEAVDADANVTLTG